jgi:lysozyme
MTDRQKLVNQLVDHEGLKLKPYADTQGILTIGVGRNLQAKGISSAEAFALLDHDIDECLHDLASFAWFPALDDVRQRVIVDVRFNLGANGFRGFAKMIHALAIGDLATAATELLNSTAAKQNMNRYNRLARMLRTGFDELN